MYHKNQIPTTQFQSFTLIDSYFPANAESIMSGFLVLKPGVGSSSRAAKSVKLKFPLPLEFLS